MEDKRIKKNFTIHFLLFSICVLAFFSCTIHTFAANVRLTWSPNSEADLAGYKMYYGRKPRTGDCPQGGYTNSVYVGNVTSHTFVGLKNNEKYFFSLSAVDTSGNESCFSEEVSKVITSSTSSASVVEDGLVSNGENGGGDKRSKAVSKKISIRTSSSALSSGSTTSKSSNVEEKSSTIINKKTSTSTLPVYTFTRDLSFGSRGEDVVILQNILISQGYLAEGSASGNFYSLTQTALSAYQKANGIFPATGYFGPLTRSSIRAYQAQNRPTQKSEGSGLEAFVRLLIALEIIPKEKAELAQKIVMDKER